MNIIFWPIFSVLIIVLLVFILKREFGLSEDPLGPDLNIFTYGYCWDITLRAIQNKPYWLDFDSFLGLGKKEFIATALLVNSILLAANFRLSTFINSTDLKIFPKYLYRFLSIFMGLIGIFIYLYISSFWD